MKLNLSLKLLGVQFTITLVVILLMIACASLGWLSWLPGFDKSQWIWISILSATLSSLFGGVFAWYGCLKRIKRLADTSQACLRGEKVPIKDGSQDEIGRLSEALDRLVQLLFQDEQDLAELRLREDRLVDQVRALSIAEERSRLARELHDGVKQQLFSMAMTASAIQDRVKGHPERLPPDLAEMVGELKAISQNAQHDLTNLLDGLRPKSIHERGLAATLNEYTLLFGAREHLLIYLEVQGNDGLVPLPLAETIYLVAKEALNNVARHARATRVDIKLSSLPEEVDLVVRDNGVGFDLSQPHHGMGITNMQERLVAIGGRLSLQSSPGRGTIVFAQVGLANPLSPEIETSRLDPNRPLPVIDNWLWLGQRLVIPVGQTWPWSPSDENYLRQPLLEAGREIVARYTRRWVGIGKRLHLKSGGISVVVSLNPGNTRWRANKAGWSLKRTSGVGRQVLYRNGLPLAAVQYQGRQVNMWTEIIYAGHGYRLSGSDRPGVYELYDEDGRGIAQVVCNHRVDIQLQRSAPLYLLLIVLSRILDTHPAVVKS